MTNKTEQAKEKVEEEVIASETRKCGVCGEVKDKHQVRRTSSGHIICYACAKIAVEEKLLVEDSDDLLYDYKIPRMNYQAEMLDKEAK